VISLISLSGLIVELSLPEKAENSLSKLFILKPISESLGYIFSELCSNIMVLMGD